MVVVGKKRVWMTCCILLILVQRAGNIQANYLSEFLSAMLSSIGITTAMPVART